ncbi:hypothetical protein BCR35DRAFT_335726 [Leucosporidium creatinivorum]|uniref:Uncharacterized protein n=1 Tax=Leucosporidium creatinivorum TaxID=106004 RepID=A0A1Y2D7Z0_9BASI|nr:hypothetical protein BCR35DRAFT_335726 [Leucosporidium creatinivorum]
MLNVTTTTTTTATSTTVSDKTVTDSFTETSTKTIDLTTHDDLPTLQDVTESTEEQDLHPPESVAPLQVMDLSSPLPSRFPWTITELQLTLNATATPPKRLTASPYRSCTPDGSPPSQRPFAPDFSPSVSSPLASSCSSTLATPWTPTSRSLCKRTCVNYSDLYGEPEDTEEQEWERERLPTRTRVATPIPEGLGALVQAELRSRSERE